MCAGSRPRHPPENRDRRIEFDAGSNYTRRVMINGKKKTVRLTQSVKAAG